MPAQAAATPLDEPKPDMRVTVTREFTADRINAILNHPKVRPWVADMKFGEIDVTLQAANPDNILLVGEHGAFLLLCIMPGVYETHSQCVPEGRGPWMKEFLEASLRWFFTRSNGWELTTRVPHGHLSARALTKMAGFRHEFTREGECRFMGRDVAVDIYRMSIHDWIEESAWAEELGNRFHDQLNAEATRLGITAPPHADDPNHSRVVGAALEMARHGQAVKAVLIFNRWAYLARHAQIALISQDPPIVRMDIGDLRLTETGIEVTPC